MLSNATGNGATARHLVLLFIFSNHGHRSMHHFVSYSVRDHSAVMLQILQTEGVRGFYRGCATNLLRTTPAAAITFTSYEVISRNLNRVADAVKGQQAASVSESSQAPG